MKELNIIEEYINYSNLNGHNYSASGFNNDIILAWSKKKCPSSNGGFMSPEEIISIVDNPQFIKRYKCFACDACKTNLVMSDHAIRLLKNNKFIIEQDIKSINNYLFYLNCIEMQIKNLLE